jgi:hypothetical protein
LVLHTKEKSSSLFVSTLLRKIKLYFIFFIRIKEI